MSLSAFAVGWVAGMEGDEMAGRSSGCTKADVGVIGDGGGVVVSMRRNDGKCARVRKAARGRLKGEGGELDNGLKDALAVREEDFVEAFGGVIGKSETDLEKIDASYRRKVVAFLLAYRLGYRCKVAMDYSGVSAWYQVYAARKASESYRLAFDWVRECIGSHDAIRTEETMVKMANGEVERVKGMIPPDVRAGQTVLAANDPKYKQGAAAPVTAISISMNI